MLLTFKTSLCEIENTRLETLSQNDFRRSVSFPSSLLVKSYLQQ